MKTFLCFLLLLFEVNFCISQNSPLQKNNRFDLDGQITSSTNNKIVIKYQDAAGEWITDTSDLINGKFTFDGDIDDPTYAMLYFFDYDRRFGQGNFAEFFMEPDKMSFQAQSDDLSDFLFFGSKTQDVYKKYLFSENELKVKFKTVFETQSRLIKESYDTESGSVREKELRDSLELLSPALIEYNNLVEEMRYKFILHNPNTAVSAYFLTRFRRRLTLDFEKQVYDGFSEEIKNSLYGKQIKKDIGKRTLVAIGAQAPDFALINRENEKISLSDLKGNFVLIDFWASWCVPCRKEVPLLKKLFEEYHSKGLKIVMISLDRVEPDWKKAIQEDGVFHFFNTIINENITKFYENVYLPIPSKILIDRNGIIIWKDFYLPEFQSSNASLESILKTHIK